MHQKKIYCRIDDYIEPKPSIINGQTFNFTLKPQASFKLDRIYPKNIEFTQQNDLKENKDLIDLKKDLKKLNIKNLSMAENLFYDEYISIKNESTKNANKRCKISQIFNIKSINLVQKTKIQKEKYDYETFKKMKGSSSIPKKSAQQRFEKQMSCKENFKGLNLILTQKGKKTQKQNNRSTVILDRKNSIGVIPKFTQESTIRTILISKSDKSFQAKLNDYLTFLKSSSDGLMLKDVTNYPKNFLTYHIGRGNNGFLIKQVMKKRWWWSVNEQKIKKNPNFSWTQLKDKNYYAKSEQNSPQLAKTFLHNHFESNQFLGNKKALFYNMKNFYEKQNRNVFEYLPVTFHIKNVGDEAWREFLQYFQKDRKNAANSKRLWIVKPGENTNRGTGITIHQDVQKIKTLVQSQLSDKKTFIIQKYIDRPLLYNKRKFDIRCYMLLTRLNGTIKGYWYSEGYIRTSSFEFQLGDTDNDFVHLTNDAIQINCQKYGKFQDGNKLSYTAFQKYLDQTPKKLKFIQEILPKLKKIGTETIEATYPILGTWNNLPTFELFGLDFMIDDSFKPWLIEVNTNPCLQTSASTLQRIIPRVVDSALQLSLDILFPPPTNWPNSKKHYLGGKASQNMFELVFEQSKRQQLPSANANDLIIEMGQIQESNQIYEQPDHQKQFSKTITLS